MKHADPAAGVVFALKIQQEIEQNTAVFTAAERYIDVFKFMKQIMKAFLAKQFGRFYKESHDYRKTVCLLGIRADESLQRYTIIVRFFVEASELFGEILLRHPVTVMVKRFVYGDHIGLLRSFTDPKFFFFIVPRVPVHFVAAKGRSGCHRDRKQKVRIQRSLLDYQAVQRCMVRFTALRLVQSRCMGGQLSIPL